MSTRTIEGRDDSLICIFCQEVLKDWRQLKKHLEQHVIDYKERYLKLLSLIEKSDGFSENENLINISDNYLQLQNSNMKASDAKEPLIIIDENQEMDIHKKCLNGDEFNLQENEDIKNEEKRVDDANLIIHDDNLQMEAAEISVDVSSFSTSDDCSDNILQDKIKCSEEDLSQNTDLSRKLNKCLQCSRSFKSIGHLSLHINHKHKPVTTTCQVCLRNFSTKANLNLHMKLHSGERPYSCDICSKTFSRKGTLQSHLLYHTGERKFICESCGALFYTSYTLQRHLKLHTGSRLHCCSQCSSTFVTNSDLKRHEATHLIVKPFPCSLCDKTFARKYDLKIHLKYHSKNREFKCLICQKEFVEKSNYTRHLREHTGEKPYKCTLCDLKLAQLRHLKKHKMTCHKVSLEEEIPRDYLTPATKKGHLEL